MKGSVAGMGTVGIWATSPCDLLSLQGLLSRVTRVPLPSDDRVSAAVPTYLHGSVHQVTPSSWWAAQVTWSRGGPRLSVQSLLRPRSRPRAVPHTESSDLQRVAGLCPQGLKASSEMHPRACRGSTQRPYLALPLHMDLHITWPQRLQGLHVFGGPYQTPGHPVAQSS